MRLRAVLLTVLLAITLSCSCIYIPTRLERTLLESSSAVAILQTDDAHCTAFNIGNDIMVSAAHCLGSTMTIIDKQNREYDAQAITVDKIRDIMLLRVIDYRGNKLELFTGTLLPGAELVATGYPGTYDGRYAFEHGYLMEQVNIEGVNVLISEGLAFRGMSGGPVIDVASNKVVGLTSSLLESIDWLNIRQAIHQHHSLAVAISYTEIQDAVEKSTT